VGASGVDAARLATAVAHADIDAHPPGVQGASHGAPVFPQVPSGILDDAFQALMVAARGAAWLACIAFPASRADMPPMEAIARPSCMRQAVPLPSNESWSSSALDSTALTR